MRSRRSSHEVPQRSGEHQREHLGVAGGGEPEATVEQFVAQRRCVDEVAVVGHRQRAVHRLDEEGLDVAVGVGPRGAVAGVADRVVAGEGRHRLGGEHAVHQSRVLVEPDPVAVADGDAGGFLAAVLQCEQTEERELCHAFAVRGADAEDAALLARRVVVRVVPAVAGVEMGGTDRDAAHHAGSSETGRAGASARARSRCGARLRAIRSAMGASPGTKSSPVIRSYAEA